MQSLHQLALNAGASRLITVVGTWEALTNFALGGAREKSAKAKSATERTLKDWDPQDGEGFHLVLKKETTSSERGKA